VSDTRNAEWFEEWFGEDYVALYPHRNEAEAERAVALIARTVGIRPVRKALDLACGSGRHARYLGKEWWTSGIDLSEVLLGIARRNSTPARLVRGDIRALPYRDSAFDLVVNLFTSFGYFETDQEHELVIRDLARVIAPRGMFVLDYLNAERVREHLVSHDERSIGGRVVAQTREITSGGRFVVKHISLASEGRKFVERVRLFTRRELEEMMERAGFRIETAFGDYGGEPLTDASPRVILFASRS